MLNILTWCHVNSQAAVIYNFVTEVALLLRFTNNILMLRFMYVYYTPILPCLGLQPCDDLTGDYKTLTYYQTMKLKLL
jgi:hypothetical protein